MRSSNFGRVFGASIALCAFCAGGQAQVAEPDSSSLAFQDWVVNCTTTPKAADSKPGDKAPPPACEMVQSFIDKTNQRLVARVAVGRPVPGGDLKLVVLAPIVAYLPDGASVSVSSKQQVKAVYTRCAPAACYAEADAKKDFLDAAKSADKLTLGFSDGARSPITLMISTKGFAAALAALDKK